ncbi:hypothetical protein NL108_013196, partial [Boleophthalmus pectinirostris]
SQEKRIFQIPWMHAARHGWDLEKDAPLFMRWAIHTGKYRPGVDRPDPKTWKANFRCAMNSLPDIEEVKDKSIKKGTNAFRVYKMLSSSERSMRRGKKRIDKETKVKGSRVSLFCHVQCSLKDALCNFPGGTCLSPWRCYCFVWNVPQYTIIPSVNGATKQLHFHLPSSEEGHMVLSEQLPFVCQTVEVTTEDSQEQTVTSSHSYPLQISPVSSYGHDTESDTEETNK